MARGIRPLPAVAVAAALLAPAAGCGPAARPPERDATAPRTAASPGGDGTVAEGAFALPDRGATAYSGRPVPAAPLGGLGARIRDAIPGALAADGRLDEVAALIVAAEETGIRVTAEFSRDLLWWRGVPEPQTVLGLFSGAADEALVGRVAAWAAEELAGGARRHGLALREIPGGMRVVALVLRPGAELDPVPRRVEEPGTLTLAGRVPDGTKEVTLVATGPDEREAKRPARREGDRFRVEALLDAEGIWQVELMGEGPRGPAVLANFPVYVGVPLPAAVGVAAAELESRDPRRLEDILFGSLAAVRAARGLAPLRRSAALDEVARRYSKEMAGTGVVAHVSPRSGGPADRAAAAGLYFPRLRENLARAHSAAEAHAGLMGSPSHRANMLDPQAREVGVGVVLVDGEGGTYLLATQLVVSRPAEIDARATEREIAGEAARRRALGGVRALVRSPGLDRAARRLLGSCFGGPKPRDVDFGDDGLARVVAFEVTAAGLDGVLEGAPPALLAPETTHLGVAVVQGTDPKHGEGMICLRLLLGQRR